MILWVYFMLFVPIEQLTPGMKLARDINLFGTSRTLSVLLRSGQTLTGIFISKLKYCNIPGAYVESDFTNDIQVHDAIDEKLKIEALSDIKQIFFDFRNNHTIVDKNYMRGLENIARKLVEDVACNADFLIDMIELKGYDDYTYFHSLNVAILSIAIGISLELDEFRLYEIALSGLLHDIGKIAIPINIINKPSALTTEEYEIVKEHPINAANHLNYKNAVSSNVYYAVISHHEKYDGTGYPYGLEGSNIHLYGRILAVADVYDALTSNRPYRKPCFPNEAIEFIMGNSGVHFDPDVVRAFLKRVAPYPIGTCVRLSNGCIGVVVKNTYHQPLRPVVRLINGDRSELNLLDDPNLRSVVITDMGYDAISNKPALA